MADSRQTLACGLLSVALLIGLGLNYLFGLWQADPVIGLVIVVFLVREGRRAVEGRKTLHLRLLRPAALAPRLIRTGSLDSPLFTSPSPAKSGFLFTAGIPYCQLTAGCREN